MNKKLIALAIAGAFAAPVAMADTGNVVIFGKMHLSYDMLSTGDASTPFGTSTSGVSTNQVSSNNSRIGFKGSEDLGNGLSAVWQVDQAVNADGEGSGAFGGAGLRNTFIGLKGNTWGTVMLGRHDTPYKTSTRKLDPFGDGIADNRNIMGGVKVSTASNAMFGSSLASFDQRASDMVAYMSPDFNGFKGSVAYVAGAEKAANGQTKGDAWSAAGTYSNGPLYVALAYERHNFGTSGSGDLASPNFKIDLGGTTFNLTTPFADREEHAWKLGAGYKIDAFTVAAVYEKTSDDLGNADPALSTACGGSDCLGHHAYTLAGTYTMGNNVLKAAYTRAGDLGNVSNTGGNQWAVGVDHHFSKRTTIYALYSKINNDSDANYRLGTVAGAYDNSPGWGADPSAVSIGMIHVF